jgi:DNA-directed RNA polymerase specialized sigma24 family protein
METANLQEQVVEALAKLEDGAKLKDVIHKVNEIIELLNTKPKAQRDRGPESTREMTEDDARHLLLGQFAKMNHKEAAQALGLSYGQVYSARKGFTFKGVYKEWRDAGNK